MAATVSALAVLPSVRVVGRVPSQSARETYCLILKLRIICQISKKISLSGALKPSPQCHIQHHHHAEAYRKKHRANVGVLSLRHFRDQFLHHHIQHGSGKKVKGFAVL